MEGKDPRHPLPGVSMGAIDLCFVTIKLGGISNIMQSKTILLVTGSAKTF